MAETTERYVLPEHLADRPLWDRIDWLLRDMKDDDLMSGVPRYRHRYTEREQQIGAYLRAAVEHRQGRRRAAWYLMAVSLLTVGVLVASVHSYGWEGLLMFGLVVAALTVSDVVSARFIRPRSSA